MANFKTFMIPFVISLVIVPFVKRIANKLDIVAVENDRSVHKGRIARIGGIAVYVAFTIALTFFVQLDDSITGILIGGFLVFIGGLLDDIYDLPPIVKLMFQCAGAVCVMFLGNIYLDTIQLPYGINIDMSILSVAITFIWIIGITNAINLIDGIDGLSSGFSIIVLITICILSTINNRPDVLLISLTLAGATSGFLMYNFHPATIFIGDCGAQFLGFMIASISLLGFKGGTFITLAIPIILLFIPIMDTLIAILRRKLEGKSFAQADKNHLHHTLMREWKLGQRETVLVIYAITAMFGVAAYLYVVDKMMGLVVLGILILCCEIFIEATGMISVKYRPILGIIARIKSVANKEKKK